MQIIDGKGLAAEIKASLAEQVAGFPEKYGRAPHLVVILVGDDPASATYVRNKTKACEVVGVKNTTLTFPAAMTEEELLAEVARLNADDSVDGVLIQLPLPKHIDENRAISAVAKEKDVDGFHPLNCADLWQKRSAADFTLPCTPKGIIEMIKSTGTKIAGKRAVVIGRSNIVGLPVAKLLLNENATVTICHSRTENIPAVTSEADILVAAVGIPKFVTAEMVKEGAVVIDVGINRDSEGKLCGDVDFDSVAPKSSYITPVPGGVGPMTIACLMENTVECFVRKFNK